MENQNLVSPEPVDDLLKDVLSLKDIKNYKEKK